MITCEDIERMWERVRATPPVIRMLRGDGVLVEIMPDVEMRFIRPGGRMRSHAHLISNLDEEGGDVSKPKWSSSFYAGAAEAALREADEAAKFDFRSRAEQFAMAARDIAVLEAINAKLLEVLEEMDKALEECVFEIDTRYGPPGSNRIDRELIERARAALAKARKVGYRD